MKKLELKHLAPYLPYNVNMLYDFEMGDIWTLDTTNINAITEHDKPILRPLSDLINHSCYELLSNNLRFNIDMLGFPNHYDLKVNDYNILIENHFDVFGLIEKGLAIDINTLNQKK